MIIILIVLLLVLGVFILGIVSAAAPPKERCPKCGGDIYPVEMDNDIYKECSECGWNKYEELGVTQEKI